MLVDQSIFHLYSGGVRVFAFSSHFGVNESLKSKGGSNNYHDQAIFPHVWDIFGWDFANESYFSL
jgi:hypothetical protein